MSTVRRLAVVFTALGVLLGVGAVAASPAFAAYDGCTFGYVCMYSGNGGTGTRHSYAGVSGFCTNIGDVPNTANSFYNRRDNGKHVQFYDGPDCNGAVLCKDGGFFMCPGSLSDPHAAGTHATFIDRPVRAGVEINHKNKASSIWFNNG